MKQPDYLCVDSLAPAVTTGGWVLRGWWRAAESPACVVLETAEGAAEPVWLGHRRDDLNAAFADSTGHAHTGFLGWIRPAPAAGAASTEPERGRWWFADTLGTWRVVDTRLDQRTPQGWFADDLPPVRPPEPVLAAAARHDDLETHFRIALAGRRALTLRLDIINKCNLRCVMCHYSEDDIFRRPTRLVTPEQFRTWFEPLAPQVHEVMLSCADEPLLSRHFAEIVRLLRGIAPHVAIRFCTNAMMLTPGTARLLVEQQVDEILFSFDACTRAMLERIRKGADYERVVHNILRLARTREAAGSALPALGVNFVMMVQNIHEAPVFVHLARRLGVATIDFRHLVNGYDRFKLHGEQLSTQPDRFNHYRDEIAETARSQGLFVYLPPALEGRASWTPDDSEPHVTLDEFDATVARFDASSVEVPSGIVARPSAGTGAGDWPSMFELFAGSYCMRPFTEVFIREQLEVLPCPWHHRVLGTLDGGANLAELFASEAFARLRRNMRTPEGDPHCSGCPFKSMELPGDRVG